MFYRCVVRSRGLASMNAIFAWNKLCPAGAARGVGIGPARAAGSADPAHVSRITSPRRTARRWGPLRRAWLLLLLGVLAPVSQAASQILSDVNLEWDPSPSTEIAGYRVYWGVLSRLYTGSKTIASGTSVTISSLV